MYKAIFCKLSNALHKYSFGSLFSDKCYLIYNFTILRLRNLLLAQQLSVIFIIPSTQWQRETRYEKHRHLNCVSSSSSLSSSPPLSSSSLLLFGATVAEWLESLTYNHLPLTAVGSSLLARDFGFFHVRKLSSYSLRNDGSTP